MANVPVVWADGSKVVWADGTTVVVWSEEAAIEPPPEPPTGGVVTEAKGAAFPIVPLHYEAQPAGTQALVGNDVYCRQIDNWTNTNTIVTTGNEGLFAGEVADQLEYNGANAELRSTFAETFDGNASAFTFIAAIRMPLVGSTNVIEFEVHNTTAAAATASAFYNVDGSFTQTIGRDAGAIMYGYNLGYYFDATTEELFNIAMVTLVCTDTATNALTMAIKLLASGCVIRPIYAGYVKNTIIPDLIVPVSQSADVFEETLAEAIPGSPLTIYMEMRINGASGPAPIATIFTVQESAGDTQPRHRVYKQLADSSLQHEVTDDFGVTTKSALQGAGLLDDDWHKVAWSVGENIAISFDGATIRNEAFAGTLANTLGYLAIAPDPASLIDIRSISIIPAEYAIGRLNAMTAP